MSTGDGDGVDRQPHLVHPVVELEPTMAHVWQVKATSKTTTTRHGQENAGKRASERANIEKRKHCKSPKVASYDW